MKHQAQSVQQLEVIFCRDLRAAGARSNDPPKLATTPDKNDKATSPRGPDVGWSKAYPLNDAFQQWIVLHEISGGGCEAARNRRSHCGF